MADIEPSQARAEGAYAKGHAFFGNKWSKGRELHSSALDGRRFTHRDGRHGVIVRHIGDHAHVHFLDDTEDVVKVADLHLHPEKVPSVPGPIDEADEGTRGVGAYATGHPFHGNQWENEAPTPGFGGPGSAGGKTPGEIAAGAAWGHAYGEAGAAAEKAHAAEDAIADKAAADFHANHAAEDDTYEKARDRIEANAPEGRNHVAGQLAHNAHNPDLRAAMAESLEKEPWYREMVHDRQQASRGLNAGSVATKPLYDENKRDEIMDGAVEGRIQATEEGLSAREALSRSAGWAQQAGLNPFEGAEDRTSLGYSLGMRSHAYDLGAHLNPAADARPTEHPGKSLETGIVKATPMSGGLTNYGVSKVHFGDGTTGVIKIAPEPIVGREIMGTRVAQAAGATVPDIHEAEHGQVVQSYVPGKTGEETDLLKIPGNEPNLDDYIPQSITRTESGQKLGVADLLMLNGDRNPGNIILHGGKTTGIDHGHAFLRGPGWWKNRSPFSVMFQKNLNRSNQFSRNQLDPGYTHSVRQNLVRLKPDFEHYNMQGSYQAAHSQLDALEAASKEPGEAKHGTIWENPTNPDENPRFIKNEDGTISRHEPDESEHNLGSESARHEAGFHADVEAGNLRRTNPAEPGTLWRGTPLTHVDTIRKNEDGSLGIKYKDGSLDHFKEDVPFVESQLGYETQLGDMIRQNPPSPAQLQAEHEWGQAGAHGWGEAGAAADHAAHPAQHRSEIMIVRSASGTDELAALRGRNVIHRETAERGRIQKLHKGVATVHWGHSISQHPMSELYVRPDNPTPGDREYYEGEVDNGPPYPWETHDKTQTRDWRLWNEEHELGADIGRMPWDPAKGGGTPREEAAGQKWGAAGVAAMHAHEAENAAEHKFAREDNAYHQARQHIQMAGPNEGRNDIARAMVKDPTNAGLRKAFGESIEMSDWFNTTKGRQNGMGQGGAVDERIQAEKDGLTVGEALHHAGISAEKAQTDERNKHEHVARAVGLRSYAYDHGVPDSKHPVHPEDGIQPDLSESIKSGILSAEPVIGGAINHGVSKVRFGDGSLGIVKFSPKKEKAQEIMGARVAQAVGAHVPEVREGEGSTLVQRWAPGRHAANGDEQQSPEGKKLGIADQVMGNSDRGGGGHNWKWGPGKDGRNVVFGIDQGYAFKGGGEGSFFARAGRKAAESGEFGEDYKSNALHALVGLKSEMEARDLGAHYQPMIDRFKNLFGMGGAGAGRAPAPKPAVAGTRWERIRNPAAHGQYRKEADGAIIRKGPDGEERRYEGDRAERQERMLHENVVNGNHHRVDPADPGTVWKNEGNPGEEWHKGEGGQILHLHPNGRAVVAGAEASDKEMELAREVHAGHVTRVDPPAAGEIEAPRVPTDPQKAAEQAWQEHGSAAWGAHGAPGWAEAGQLAARLHQHQLREIMPSQIKPTPRIVPSAVPAVKQ